MDLDEEELKATRILNGADKSIDKLDMSEEEKKAIEKIKELIAHKNDVDLFMGYEISRPFTIGREMIEEIEPILNLIEKQQKEIETLKSFTSPIFNNEFNEEYISTQEIKDKIKQYN